MSYVISNLTQGETIVTEAKTHWWLYAGPGVAIAFGIIFMGIFPVVGIGFMGAGLFLLAKRALYAISTELAVTTKRVVAKFGFISRSTIELGHGKVESLHVEQSILGRMLNFGTVIIKGSGGTNTPIPMISDPLRFRSLALAAIESR